MYRLFIASIPISISPSTVSQALSSRFPTCTFESKNPKGRHPLSYNAILEVQSQEEQQAALRDSIFVGNHKLEISPFLEKRQRQAFDKELQGRKIHLSCLPKDANRAFIISHFEKFGSIEEIYIRRKSSDGALLYAFITYTLARVARKLIEAERLWVDGYGYIKISLYRSLSNKQHQRTEGNHGDDDDHSSPSSSPHEDMGPRPQAQRRRDNNNDDDQARAHPNHNRPRQYHRQFGDNNDSNNNNNQTATATRPLLELSNDYNNLDSNPRIRNYHTLPEASMGEFNQANLPLVAHRERAGQLQDPVDFGFRTPGRTIRWFVRPHRHLLSNIRFNRPRHRHFFDECLSARKNSFFKEKGGFLRLP